MSTQPPSREPAPTTRQSALSATREPFVPPRQVLDQVQGRFLDPGTALSVRGVRPRSTVYVGPRVIVSVTPDVAEVVSRLQAVAESLGWEAEVNPDDADELGGQRDERAVPGVVRLELVVRDETATQAPDGWVLQQNARARYGIDPTG